MTWSTSSCAVLSTRRDRALPKRTAAHSPQRRWPVPPQNKVQGRKQTGVSHSTVGSGPISRFSATPIYTLSFNIYERHTGLVHHSLHMFEVSGLFQIKDGPANAKNLIFCMSGAVSEASGMQDTWGSGTHQVVSPELVTI